jgi:D-alanine-D-alanine ligase
MQNKLHPLSVAILYYSGTNEDDEDTIAGVKGIEESLKRTGHNVTKIIVTEKNLEQSLSTPADIVFNFVEDDSWELYEKVAFGLEKLHRAQVGHDITGLAYAIKKTPIKRMMKDMYIATPDFKIFSENSKIINQGTLRFPVIIKPCNQHAGIGISQDSVVTNAADLKSKVKHIIRMYPGDVMAEEYIDGREIHVTLLGNGKQLTVLPYCEIGFKGEFKNHWNVYTYKAKWSKSTWEYDDARVDAPAKIPTALQANIKKLALNAYGAFKCRDIARFDIRIDKHGTPFIVDLNMNPSINYYDDQDATLASVYALGWTYDRFIEKLLAITYARVHGHQVKDKRLRK